MADVITGPGSAPGQRSAKGRPAENDARYGDAGWHGCVHPLALRAFKGIVAVPEPGEIYKGKVKTITPYGAFVEILPGKDGLLHISEIEHRRLEKVEEVLKEGQEIEVKLLSVDEKSGKLKLSRKALLPKPEKKN